jgi:hypothetical protein
MTLFGKKHEGGFQPRLAAVCRAGQFRRSNFSSRVMSGASSATAVAATIASGSLGRGDPERRMPVAMRSIASVFDFLNRGEGMRKEARDNAILSGSGFCRGGRIKHKADVDTSGWHVLGHIKREMPVSGNINGSLDRNHAINYTAKMAV